MYRIVAVEYLNTLPYIRAIQNSALLASKIEIVTADPKECAKALLTNSADLVLLPVGSFADFDKLYMPLNFGIACYGKVYTVCIFSDKKWEDISIIRESVSSRSSNKLLELLNHNFWNNSKQILDYNSIKESDAMLIIGDEAFEAHQKFKYVYDLGEIWKQNTGLPFVFAVWMSRKILDDSFIQLMDKAFEEGVKMDALINLASGLEKNSTELISYFKSNILFKLDEKMLESLKLFFKLNKWNWNIEINAINS
ncbi:MAG: menaquinone biosynthesis protein [Saprospiraceae bacterium]